jgi:hypothetical protein
MSDSILIGPVLAALLYYVHFHKAYGLLYTSRIIIQSSAFCTQHIYVSYDSHNKQQLFPSTMWQYAVGLCNGEAVCFC